jgi:hypothetical protein
MQTKLNLTFENFDVDGLTPEESEQIWDEIRSPIGERDRDLLMCTARAAGLRCKAEESGVKSPYMAVRKQRGADGTTRYVAAHLPTAHEVTAEESDKHKAAKDFIARTCDRAGLRYGVEKATTRRRRPDVTVEPDGGVGLGCEAQYYNASAGNVRHRSRLHAEAGLTANWITDDNTFHLIDRANYLVTPRYTWKEISDASDLATMNGVRVLVEWHCSAAGSDGRPCPNGKITRGGIIGTSGCGKVHLQWETPRLVDDGPDGYGTKTAYSVGRVLVGAATGEMSSLFVSGRKDHRSGRYLWVPTADKARWLDYSDGEEDQPEDEDSGSDDVEFSQRETDDSCHYGEDTGTRSAPLPRRGISAAGLTLTVDAPAEVATGQRPAEHPNRVTAPQSHARCPGCGRPASHRTLSGVRRHYPGCPTPA